MDAEPRRALRAQRRRLRYVDTVQHRRRQPDRSAQSTGATRRSRTPTDLFSYRAGVVFKPVEAGSSIVVVRQQQDAVEGLGQRRVHARRPATSIRKPRSTSNSAPSGTVGKRLSLTAAVFRNERENYKVADPGNPANPSGEQQLDGEARVDGIALGVAGQITRRLVVFANSPTSTAKCCRACPTLPRRPERRVRRLDRQAPTRSPACRSAARRSTRAACGPRTTCDAWTFGYGVDLPGRATSTDTGIGANSTAADQGLHHAPRDGVLRGQRQACASSSTPTTCSTRSTTRASATMAGRRRAMRARVVLTATYAF